MRLGAILHGVVVDVYQDNVIVSAGFEIGIMDTYRPVFR